MLPKNAAALDEVNAEIEKIKQQGLAFEKTKNSSCVENVRKSIARITELFDFSAYQGGDLFPEYATAHNLWIITGENMDQRENLWLGTWTWAKGAVEKMSVEGLGLKTLEITKPDSTWLLVCENAEKTLQFETHRLEAYLTRLVYMIRFRPIQQQYGFATFLADRPRTSPGPKKWCSTLGAKKYNKHRCALKG